MFRNNDWLPYWQPDFTTNSCNYCLISFSLLNRKHHCRKCGKIFCYNCWGEKIFLPIYNKKVPVCNSCYNK